MSRSALDQVSISAVVVSYYSEGDLLQCLESLVEVDEVVVVEQAARGSAAQVVATANVSATTRVVRAGANRGFGAGCNLGAANASGQVLLFVNPDAVLGTGAAAILAGRAWKEDCIVGPNIAGADGERQTEARRWSSIVRDAIGIVLPEPAVPAWLSRDIPADDLRYKSGGAVDYLQGSCFAVRRDTFFRLGGCDERYFLYGEEESLARRGASAGVVSFLEPAAEVTHVGQTSTDHVGNYAVYNMYRSHALTYADQGGWARSLLAALAFGLAIGVLAVTLPIRKHFGPRRTRDLAWCAAATRGLRHGLTGRLDAPPAPSAMGDHWITGTESAESSGAVR